MKKPKKLIKAKHLLFVIVLFGICWIFFLDGPRVATDYPLSFISKEGAKITLPQVWSSRGAEGLGEYSVGTLWSWPVSLAHLTLAKLGASFELRQTFLYILPIFLLGIWSTTNLYKFLSIKKPGRYIGSLFYLLNTYIILIIDGGQLSIGLAYAWFPMAYLKVITSIAKGLKEKVVAGLAVSALGFFDIRFVYILFILLFLRFLYEFLFLTKARFAKWITSWLKSTAVITFIVLGLNSYWIIPALLAGQQILPASLTRVAQASFLSFATLGHSLLLLQPHWFKNVFGKVTSIKPEFLLIPVLVFLAPVLTKRKKVIGFWILTALLSVFLVKGSMEPAPQVYPWLFSNIPGFSIFRDPTKFFFLVSLSYSVLIATTANQLVKRFSWKISVFRWKILAVPLVLAAYLVLLLYPVYTGKMTGILVKPIYKKEYLFLADKLMQDKEFKRVLWIPSRSPLGYSSPSHSSVDSSRLVQKRPFAIGTVGTYEVFNFLREAPFMGELFDISAIKNVAYPYPDVRREELKPDNVEYYYAFLDQLFNRNWVGGKISEPPVAALQTKKNQDHFFVAPNTFWVVGSDKLYWDLSDIKVSFSDNALIFAEENPGVLDKFKGVSNAKIISYEKTPTDIAASLIDQSRFIFPASMLDFDPTEDQKWPASNASQGNAGWWKRETADLVWWRDFLQQKYGIDNLDFDYGGGNAIAEGNQQLTMTNFQFSKGETLLARVMESSRGGKLEFWQGDERLGEIKTLIEEPEKTEVKLSGYKEIPDKVFEYEKAEFIWVEVGELSSDNPLTIKTDGEINVVNSLLVLSRDQWNQAKSKVEKLKGEGKIVNWEDLDNDEKSLLFAANDKPTVNYERINPTKYLVRVEGVTKPITLAFSETYDSLWELDGKSSYPLYSLINGFYVDQDGEYEVFFSPQRYVNPGLAISGATLFIILAVLFVVRKRSKRS